VGPLANEGLAWMEFGVNCKVVDEVQVHMGISDGIDLEGSYRVAV
jgi:hypothetical protein